MTGYFVIAAAMVSLCVAAAIGPAPAKAEPYTCPKLRELTIKEFRFARDTQLIRFDEEMRYQAEIAMAGDKGAATAMDQLEYLRLRYRSFAALETPQHGGGHGAACPW